MAEKITVKDFVDGYLKISPKVQGASGREQYVKDAVVVDYVPFRDKVSLVTRIIRATTEEVDGSFRQSSPIRYVLFMTRLIDIYTNIKISESIEMYEEYDLLNKNGLIVQLIAAISDAEYEEFKALSDMVLSDTMSNKYEVHAFFTELVNTLAKGANEVIQGISGEELANKLMTDTDK